MTTGSTIVSRFATSRDRFADRAAIVAADRQWTYAELNTRANQIAWNVRDHDLGAPARVALLFDQGAEAIAAGLGVLKAGHVFVPLDAADPRSRLVFISRDCQPFAILTDDAHLPLAQELASRGFDVINVDRIDTDARADDPAIEIDPEATAYLFYTSSSTGHAKGVSQTHRNLLHFTDSFSRGLEISAADRVSLLLSLSFSASNMDIFGSLLHGATLCSYDIRKRGTADLPGWVKRPVRRTR